jgi:hypothetical protein
MNLVRSAKELLWPNWVIIPEWTEENDENLIWITPCPLHNKSEILFLEPEWLNDDMRIA